MSKSRLDFDDPLVKRIMDGYQRCMTVALNAPQQVERAVHPVYWPFKRGRKADQGGTGVVVRIEGEHFVFSASHVFDDVGNHVLLLGTGNGELLATLAGDRFSTARGPSGTHDDDPIDASVFHIQKGLTDEIKRCAITLDDFDLDGRDRLCSAHLAVGFRVKRSHVNGNQAYTHREAFSSHELSKDGYASINRNPETHLALAYESQSYVDGTLQTVPGLKGMSGGAIIRVDGVSVLPPIFPVSTVVTQRLAAITIAVRKEMAGNPGAIIGTRVGVHLRLIEKYLPGLLP